MTLGSTGLVGRRLLQLLVSSGHAVQAVTRWSPTPSQGAVTWVQADVNIEGHVAALPPADVLISSVSVESTAAVARHLVRTGRLNRVVAFSSTSVITKADAAVPAERELAARLKAGEESLEALPAEVTILRPTMIYGGRGDGNVERIASFVTKSPVFPLIGGGIGQRQPVHAADLADAAMSVLRQPTTAGRIYNVSGGEQLTVRELVTRTASANGTTVRFLNLPLPVARLGLRAVRLVVPRFSNVPAGALERMTRDLVFDHAPAAADFGYSPRPFEPPTY